jgi:flavin reductase (DIM6/NTAB) family NADH-FMN oxidoreductase RutF
MPAGTRRCVGKRAFPLSKVYGLLEPGPVVLVATVRRGRPNLMAMSWHTMLEFEPPLVGCVISNRNYTFASLRASRECTLNIPTARLAREVVACGNASGARIDKFAAFGLTPVPAQRVGAPLVSECYANLECKVVDTTLVNRYCLFVLEVVKAWIDPGAVQPRTLHHRGRGEFFAAGRTFRLPSRKK